MGVGSAGVRSGRAASSARTCRGSVSSPWALPLLVTACLCLSSAVQAWAEETPTVRKEALAASYRPVRIAGQAWYRGYEAALLRNARAGDEARPVFLLRILGELDGKT